MNLNQIIPALAVVVGVLLSDRCLSWCLGPWLVGWGHGHYETFAVF